VQERAAGQRYAGKTGKTNILPGGGSPLKNSAIPDRKTTPAGDLLEGVRVKTMAKILS